MNISIDRINHYRERLEVIGLARDEGEWQFMFENIIKDYIYERLLRSQDSEREASAGEVLPEPQIDLSLDDPFSVL